MKKIYFIICILCTSILSIPDPVWSGPLDDINRGLNILNTLDQLRNRNGRRIIKRQRGSVRKRNFQQSRNTTRSEWRSIQNRLNELGFPAGKADGKPGRNTMKAIAAFQAANGLEVDGKNGPQTRGALFSEQARSAKFAGDIVIRQNNGQQKQVAQPDWATTSSSPNTVVAAPANLDCENQENQVKAVICSTPKLAEMDAKIEQRYQSVLAEAGADADNVRTAHEQWVVMRFSCGENVNCIESAMTMRLSMLPQTASSAETGMVRQHKSKQASSTTAILGKLLTHPNDTGTIVGQWEGVARCAEGRTFFMTLAIQRAGGVRYTAETGYVWETYLSGDNLKEKYIGEDIGDKNYEFVHQGNIDSDYDIGRYIMRNFSLAFDPANDVLRGTYPREECISFELTRTTNQSKSRVYLVDQDIKQQTYWRAATLSQKCGYLRDWFEQPYSEFRDLKRKEVDQKNAALILLADRYFVPRFGNVVDSLTFSQKKRLLADYNQCWNDPIWKSRLKPYSSSTGSTVLFWGFQDGLKSYEKPNPPTAADLNFWKMRYARNVVYLAIRMAEAESEPSVISQKILIASDRLRHYERLFFPKEIAELKGRLKATKAKSFNLKAEGKFSELEGVTDEIELLTALFKLHDARLVTMSGASAEVRQDFEAELARRQSVTLENYMSVAFSMSVGNSGQPISILGDFETTAGKLAEVNSFLIPEVKLAAERQLKEKRTSLVQDTVTVERGKLESFLTSADGIADSLEWIKAFQMSYQPYADYPPVKAIVSDFSSKRETLLQQALPAFEDDVQTALKAEGLTGARRVIETYLGWDGDYNLAISSQFLQIMANAEIAGLENTTSDMNKIVQSKSVFEDQNQYKKALSEEKYSAFKKSIMKIHETAARSLLSRVVKIDSIETMKDVETTSQRLEKAKSLFVRMIPEIATQLQIEVKTKSAAVLANLIAAEYVKLDGFKPDQTGVLASARWVENFEANFGKHKSEFDYAAVQRRFVDHRERLLGDALGSFERELAVVSESDSAVGVDNLLKQYLSWTGDKELPVALEYEFIAEASK